MLQLLQFLGLAVAIALIMLIIIQIRNNEIAQIRQLRPTHCYPWFWLLLSLILLPFTHFQTVIPIAAWLGTLFLLRFSRTYPQPFLALCFVWIVQSIALSIGLRNNWIPAPLPILFGYAVLFGFILSLAYGVDRLLSARLSGIVRTLIFPTGVTVTEWLHSLTPIGGWISLGYTQIGNLPLMQVVSLTGIWGLSFVIAWFASVANQCWELGWYERSNRRLLLSFSSILLFLLLYGDIRLAFATQTAVPTVQVAGIVPDRNLQSEATAAGPLFGREYLQAKTRQTLRDRFQPVLEDLFRRTEAEARSGAKLIVWSEGAVAVPKEDESAMIGRAQELVEQTQIYFQLSFGSILQTKTAPFYENRSVLIDPSGKILWTYDKARPVFPGEYFNQRPGTGIIPTTQTPYGQLATVICYDADFPSYIQQAGRDRADILFVPSNDGFRMRVTHQDNAVFRAIENGLSIIRPASYGISSAVDPYGRTLGRTDHYANPTTVLRAEVPVQGVQTLYAIAGDYFAILSAVGLVFLFMLAFSGAKQCDAGSRNL